ncbi:pirin family protein [Hyphomicrobium sp.]|uniref:pirin family protein n=1 Tax=Hyphomicrobium sp. TaxID=82 RepID=UPI0025BC5B9F|nr:pirin family protein [Hyphomicrobium sp.]MCC7252446.1 pirin family protein [Hyphomicrobium sp.]
MRKILGVTNSPQAHWVGDGFPVRSLLSPESGLSPFLLLDYAGPATFAPTDRPRGVGQHPHRGFETVTIVYQGELAHRDSTGNGGTIGPGDVQWMTAASGILHEEFHSEAFTRTGGTLEMVQLWVNLPAKDKKAPPGYQTLLNADIPSVDLADGAGRVRVIAGDYEGQTGPARTFTPINIWDLRLARDKTTTLTLPEGHTVALAVLGGTVLVNGEEVVRSGQLVAFERSGGAITLEANNDVTVLVLSGEPINEQVVAHGPFVMNTVGEIKQAMLDFEQGRFGAMTAETLH